MVKTEKKTHFKVSQYTNYAFNNENYLMLKKLKCISSKILVQLGKISKLLMSNAITEF
jgi:hypothetical protein